MEARIKQTFYRTPYIYSQTCIFARSPWTQRACNIRGIANIKCVEPGSVDSKGVHLYRYCKFRGLQIDGFDCIYDIRILLGNFDGEAEIK